MAFKTINEFPFQVAEEIDFTDFKVIRFLPSTDYINNENVVAVWQDGKIRWQIPKREYACENSPYMKIVREGAIVAHNWDGVNLVLEADSGIVIEKRYSK